MLFNSLAFALFLPVVYLLYWQLKRRGPRAQNLLLVAASYVFYGWWDPRFLILIVASTLVDYLVGRGIDGEERPSRRRRLLWVSVAVNLGLLGFFKYYNFFADSLVDALGGVGLTLSPTTLDIVLPVGISFYTFQTLSYTIDVYRRTIRATSDPVAFAAYVGFFPQLVAGPIERAHRLLPQFLHPRRFDPAKAADGLRQMLWGFTKKIVIADNAALLVERVYSGHAEADGITILIATFLFAIQIYCDFSGYSDIAIGCARLFGFDLMRNFALPYFSRDIGEFWARWHISLSTWFRDYLYIPLGGSRLSRAFTLRNVLIVFVVSGFWHGANWTFVVWGLLHGLYYLPLVALGRHKRHKDVSPGRRLLPSGGDALRMLTTFSLVLVAWVFFRAASVADAIAMLTRAVTHPTGSGGYGRYLESIVFALGLLAIEWVSREKQHPLQFDRLPRSGRWAVYYALCGLLLLKGNFGHVPFIYFQF